MPLVESWGPTYLATLVYRVGKAARGTHAIDLLHDPHDPAQRTVLFGPTGGAPIDITSTEAALIRIQSQR